MSHLNAQTQLCRSCGARYPGERFACTTCDVGLVDEAGEPVLALDDSVGGVGLDLEGWTFKQRTELVDLLSREGVRHRWDGHLLVVADDDVELVEALQSQVEGVAHEVDQGDVEEVGYDLDDWLPDQHAELVSLLAAEGIPHRWEGNEVVVAEAHADRTEELIDDIDHPDAIPIDPDGEDGGGELLGTIFVAADVLARDASDPGGVRDLLDVAEVVDAAPVPYGLDVALWDGIRRMTGELADLLGSDADEEAVSSSARSLRDALREMV